MNTLLDLVQEQGVVDIINDYKNQMENITVGFEFGERTWIQSIKRGKNVLEPHYPDLDNQFGIGKWKLQKKGKQIKIGKKKYEVVLYSTTDSVGYIHYHKRIGREL